MSSLKEQRLRAHLKILVLFTVWMLPKFSWGQDPSAQSSGPTLPLPFAEISESLATKADALLVSVNQPAPHAVEETPRHVTGMDLLEQRRAQWKIHGLGSAFVRVESLRPTIDPILQQEGVPVELAAVVLVESGGNASALSPKGALGLWQLMPDTARRYGLVVDGARDERLDVEKSTRAAARYLSDLHLQFGSWSLALAGYNTGEQNLRRAIDRSRSTEFTVLSSSGHLPLETRNYVPAVMAAMPSFGQPLAFPSVTPPATTVFAASSR